MPATVNGHCMPLKDVLRHYCLPAPVCEYPECHAEAEFTPEGPFCDDHYAMILEDAAELAASKAIDAYHEHERLEQDSARPTFATVHPKEV